MADIVMSDAKYVERPKVLLLAPFLLALHFLSTHWHLSEGVCKGSEHPVSSLLQHGLFASCQRAIYARAGS